MTKRLHEAGTITVEPSGEFRVCLIREGKGSSASFTREFFTTANAEALAGSLSFPGHPENIWRPELRNPLSAIAEIGKNVTIEEHNGLMGLWGTYKVSEALPPSCPDVSKYIQQYGDRLGLSIYIETDGYVDEVTGTFVATELNGNDPYKSVDLVVAAGAGGGFDRVAESLRRIAEASATAGGKEENLMEIKDVERVVEAAIAPLTKVVESLATALEGKAQVDAQAQVDAAAVEKAVEARLADYDKAVSLISEAKLTESQSEGLRELAKSGVDITTHVEAAKKVLAEAMAAAKSQDGQQRILVESHIGDGGSSDKLDIDVPGFGRVVI